MSRLQTAQIPSPEPIMLRSHVLVMDFIGRDDMYADIYLLYSAFIAYFSNVSVTTVPLVYIRLIKVTVCTFIIFLTYFYVCCVYLRPAPLLKNAVLSESKARELYLQVIQNMRIMYHEARLVHADLSEFNML